MTHRTMSERSYHGANGWVDACFGNMDGLNTEITNN